jgi:N-acetylglucosamine-6-phosphate deacetylase
VGLMPGGTALGSSVMGMDHMVRTFANLTGRPIWEVIRMASLTPARIAGQDHELGSLERGKRADIVLLDHNLEVRRVFIDGTELRIADAAGMEAVL